MSKKPKPFYGSSQKAIVIEMPDHSKWIVAAECVAHDRASHYADDTPYDQTFAETMADESELLDWAANNMNWSDIEPFAREYRKQPETSDDDFQDGWCNGEKEVIKTPATCADLFLPDGIGKAEES